MHNDKPSAGERNQRARSRFSRVAPAGIAVLAAGVLATACGGSSASPSARHSQSRQSAELAYSRCMRAHGVPNFPDPRPGGGYSHSAIQAIGGQFSPQVQAAQMHCQPQAAAAGFTHTAAQIRQHVKQLIAFAACMRKHGVPNFPDPNSQGAIVASQGSNWNPSSPQFQAAQKVCAYLNP
jgi:hypothetical protein